MRLSRSRFLFVAMACTSLASCEDDESRAGTTHRITTIHCALAVQGADIVGDDVVADLNATVTLDVTFTQDDGTPADYVEDSAEWSLPPYLGKMNLPAGSASHVGPGHERLTLTLSEHMQSLVGIRVRQVDPAGGDTSPFFALKRLRVRGGNAKALAVYPREMKLVPNEARPLFAIGLAPRTHALDRKFSGVLSESSVTFRSDNPGVAAVDPSTGLVRAIAIGAANIIAEAKDAPGKPSRSIPVTVSATPALSLGEADKLAELSLPDLVPPTTEGLLLHGAAGFIADPLRGTKQRGVLLAPERPALLLELAASSGGMMTPTLALLQWTGSGFGAERIAGPAYAGLREVNSAHSPKLVSTEDGDIAIVRQEVTWPNSGVPSVRIDRRPRSAEPGSWTSLEVLGLADTSLYLDSDQFTDPGFESTLEAMPRRGGGLWVAQARYRTLRPTPPGAREQCAREVFLVAASRDAVLSKEVVRLYTEDCPDSASASTSVPGASRVLALSREPDGESKPLLFSHGWAAIPRGGQYASVRVAARRAATTGETLPMTSEIVHGKTYDVLFTFLEPTEGAGELPPSLRFNSQVVGERPLVLLRDDAESPFGFENNGHYVFGLKNPTIDSERSTPERTVFRAVEASIAAGNTVDAALAGAESNEIISDVFGDEARLYYLTDSAPPKVHLHPALAPHQDDAKPETFGRAVVVAGHELNVEVDDLLIAAAGRRVIVAHYPEAPLAIEGYLFANLGKDTPFTVGPFDAHTIRAPLRMTRVATGVGFAAPAQSQITFVTTTSPDVAPTAGASAGAPVTPATFNAHVTQTFEGYTAADFGGMSLQYTPDVRSSSSAAANITLTSPPGLGVLSAPGRYGFVETPSGVWFFVNAKEVVSPTITNLHMNARRFVAGVEQESKYSLAGALGASLPNPPHPDSVVEAPQGGFVFVSADRVWTMPAAGGPLTSSPLPAGFELLAADRYTYPRDAMYPLLRGGDRIYMFCVRIEPEGQYVYVSSSLDGATWSTPKRVNPNGGRVQKLVRAAWDETTQTVVTLLLDDNFGRHFVLRSLTP